MIAQGTSRTLFCDCFQVQQALVLLVPSGITGLDTLKVVGPNMPCFCDFLQVQQALVAGLPSD